MGAAACWGDGGPALLVRAAFCATCALPLLYHVPQVDPQYDEHEKQYKAIMREILGEEEESEEEAGDEDNFGGCLFCTSFGEAQGQVLCLLGQSSVAGAEQG